MPRRIKLPDDQVTEAVAIKRLKSRKAYAKKTGKKALEQSIDKAIKDIQSKKSKKGKQKAIERGLENTTAKHEKEKRTASANKRRKHKTFEKKQWASDMLDELTKVFGNDFGYEIAEQIANTPGIGKQKARRMIELVKSTRDKYNERERMQLAKTYMDWQTNRKMFRDAYGVTNEKELLDFFDGKLADFKAYASGQEKKSETPKKSKQAKKSTRTRRKK